MKTVSLADATSWIVIGGFALACLLLSHALGFGVLPARAMLPALGVAVLAGALALGRRRGDARLVAGATAFLQMTLFTILGVVLAYLLAARNGPLWDGWLAAADARLGLDWPAILAASDRLPAPLLLVGGVAYHSLVLQMVGCIVVLAGTGRSERLRTTVAAAILAGAVTILLSGLLPAVGNLFDPDRYRTLWPSVAWRDHPLILGLRTGAVRQVDLSHMTGIVSFPSYHAALPVILVWGLYPVARLRAPAAIWAGLTILATPLFGGHYVVDVLAGLLLAIGALAVAARLAAHVPAPNGLRSPAIRATRPARAIGPGCAGRTQGAEVVHDLV
ncbi:phosphatase PAP2 family protein [Sphingomonas aracearum]|nr:phosphatase PAP2 family protein [Sphingomonas aracearum]